MRFDQMAIREQQRKAYAALTARTIIVPRATPGDEQLGMTKDGQVLIKNKHYVSAKLTSSPGMLIQELPWVNTSTQFIFDFSQNGPQQIPNVNNNSVIFKNDIFAVYGMQILFGTNSAPPIGSAACIYRSHGVLPADDAMYNSTVSMVTESSTYINKMEGQLFRDNPSNSNEYFGEIGLQLLNPIRIISGELGKFQIVISLKNAISGLVLSTNTVISMRLHGVYGQAQG